MVVKWDKWQEGVLSTDGNISIRCGRQVGKSTVVGKRRADLMVRFPCSYSLIIAPAQRQSSELFIKTFSWLEVLNREHLAKHPYVFDEKLSSRANAEAKHRWEFLYGIFNEIPTKTTIILKKDWDAIPSFENRGSVCYSLPAGKTGNYLRTFALDFLDVDEAAFVPDVVYNTLKPMLAVSQHERGLGWECLLSTPFGKGGFFYDSQLNPDFTHFHVSSEDCPRISKVFLKKERDRLSKAQYAQEYLGEFTDEMRQLFPSDLLKERMSFIDWSLSDRVVGSRFYLGVDIARYGGDENAFVIVEMVGKSLRVVRCVTTDRVSIVDTIGRIVAFDREFHFARVFVDDAGVGGGVLDVLQERLGRRVVGLNNASKRVQVKDDEKLRGILKEDLYSNLLMLLETKRVDLISDLRLLRSLKSITFEYNESGKVKIGGAYSHLAEATVRACWCVKDRGLALYCC